MKPLACNSAAPSFLPNKSASFALTIPTIIHEVRTRERHDESRSPRTHSSRERHARSALTDCECASMSDSLQASNSSLTK